VAEDWQARDGRGSGRGAERQPQTRARGCFLYIYVYISFIRTDKNRYRRRCRSLAVSRVVEKELALEGFKQTVEAFDGDWQAFGRFREAAKREGRGRTGMR
jgi:hypothetical protein